MDLKTSVATLPFIGHVYSARLKKLNIENLEDLLQHAPSRYLDYRKTSLIRYVKMGEPTTVKGTITSIKNIYTKSGKKMQIADVKDSTGQLSIIWFNQPYLVRSINIGVKIAFAGSLSFFGKTRAFISPEYEIIKPAKELIHTGSLIPVYRETSGISSKWLRSRIANFFPQVSIVDFLPEEIRYENNLYELSRAYQALHFPQNENEALKGKERLAFDEMLSLQLKSLIRKIKWREKKSAYKLQVNKDVLNKLLDSLNFTLTKSQKIAVDEILNNMTFDYPMNRLLEGDVGSGKTVVAAIAAFCAFLNETQAVFMVPTQLLAIQHYNTLENLLSPFKVRISLVTSAGIKSDLGKSDIFIGTHALIHKKVNFDKVSLVIIDEQHRFGVEQRTHLVKRVGNQSVVPHVLTMTATPIPRTIALTFYGDLDLTSITDLPEGRIPIKTWIIPKQKRENAYIWIQEQINKYRTQVYIICPLIDQSDKDTMIQIKAANKEYEQIKNIFPTLSVGLLHGRQKDKEKNSILSQFKSGLIDILVSTPIVEVGIDIPNATIMLIEAADRFGLADLHQLRGRVGRGQQQSYCLLFSDSSTKQVNTRLKALENSVSGSELAEIDLKLRGPGEIFGLKQHGFPELKIARWDDTELIKKTKFVAKRIYEDTTMDKSILNLASKA